MRSRNQVLSLDSGTLLTRGNPAGLGAQLSALNPANNAYTVVGSEAGGSASVIGKVTWRTEQDYARLSFFTPSELLATSAAEHVLDELARRAGEVGACNILAELEENHPFFEVLQKAGFNTYAWQRIWKINDPHLVEKPTECEWRPSRDTDSTAIHSLHQSLVPPAIQGIEPLMPQHAAGWVLYREGELAAYAEGIFGSRGIYVLSLFSPELENGPHTLCDLIGQISTLGRPVYMAVRLYQAHIERFLRDIGASESPLTAVLAKRVAVPVREEVLVKQHTRVRNPQAEPTAGMSRTISSKETKI